MDTQRTIVRNYTYESPAVIQCSTVVSVYTRKAQGEVKIPLDTPTGLNPKQAPPLLNEQEDGWARHPPALSSGTNATYRQKVHRGPSAGAVLIFAIYRVSVSTSLLPHLQLWHPNWPVCVQYVDDLHSSAPDVLQLLSHGDVATIVETD
jgi:hypothetical protein